MDTKHKNRLKALAGNDLTIMLYRIVLVYGALGVLRAVFWAYNADKIGHVSASELPALLRGGFLFDTANLCYCYGVFIFFSLLPLRLRDKSWYQRTLLWLWGVVSAIVVLVNTADAVYFHFASKRLTADEFHFTENSNTGTVVWRGILENWYLVLFMAALVFGMVWAYRAVKHRPTLIRNTWTYTGVCTVILAAAAPLLIGGMRGGFSRAIRPITVNNAAHYSASPYKAAIVLSNPFCILRTMGNKQLHYEKYFTSETELLSHFSPYHNLEPSLRSGHSAGKNIVVFVLESFSHEQSAYLNPGLYPDGRGYMPFLDSLMRNGYVFHRCYANGHKSIEALPSVLSSIPSLGNPFVLMPQSLGPMRGLGTLLGEEGYSTWFFNGSEERSMGFVAYARLTGIENFRTREDYESAKGTADFDGFWGIWDAPFLRYMAEELGKAREPFFATTFTLTSHHPFLVPPGYESRLPKGHTKVQQPTAYTDLALRGFFDYARTQPWYENTVFVFVADHVSSEKYLPETFSVTGDTHIVCFYYTPDGSLRGDSQIVTQQLDIMPTLLGLTGYTKPYLAFGRDAIGGTRPASGRLSGADDRDPGNSGFSVSYAGDLYHWVTDSTAMLFDGRDVRAIYNISADPTESDNLLPKGVVPDPTQLQRMKAFIQSYFQHVERANYTVPDSLIVR